MAKKKGQRHQRGKGMVDIGGKAPTKRTAMASALLTMGPQAFTHLLREGSPKGDALETAKIAGIMAAKSTPAIIPLCHPLTLTKVDVSFAWHVSHHAIEAVAEVHCLGRTGVEMEALTAASVAVLTIYDMMKWADKGMRITQVRLLRKTGGKSGDFIAEA